MKKYFRPLILFGMLVLSLSILPQFAKAIGNPDDPGGDPDAPIDGGIGVLLAAGVVYGLRKIRNERKSN
jgi:hypothetical protein